MFVFTRFLLFQEAPQETISNGTAERYTKIIKNINKHKKDDKQNYVFAGQSNLEGKNDVYFSVLDVLKNYAYTVKRLLVFPVGDRKTANLFLQCIISSRIVNVVFNC
jgi:hypothetical protein